MAEKTIVHGSFWYIDEDGGHLTAVRGDTVDITRDEDLKRGERHGAFATEQDLTEGSDFRTFVDRRASAVPGVVTVDPATVPARDDGGNETVVGSARPSVNDPKDTWVEYHVAQRPDDVDEATVREQVKAWTKKDLTDKAGTEYPAVGDESKG